MFFNRAKKAKEEEEAELKKYILVSRKVQAKMGQPAGGLANSQIAQGTPAEEAYVEVVKETLRALREEPGNAELKGLEKFLKERDRFEVLVKKASDFTSTVLEKLLSACQKARKKDPLKGQDLMQREVEMLLQPKLFPESLELFSRQLKGQVEITSKSVDNHLLDTIVKTLTLLMSLDAGKTEGLQSFLGVMKSLLFTCLDFSSFKHHVVNHHTVFSIRCLGFSSDKFDNGYKLFEPLFLKTQQYEENYDRSVDRFRLYVENFCFVAQKLEPVELKKRLLEFLNLFFTDNFTTIHVQSYPEELTKLLEKTCQIIRKDDEDFFKKLLMKVHSLCSNRVYIRTPEGDVNPFCLTVSRLFVLILRKYNYENVDIWGDLFDSLLGYLRIALNAFDDLSFFSVLPALTAHLFSPSNGKISSIFGDFIQKVCTKTSRMKFEGKDKSLAEILSISKVMVQGIEPRLFELDPVGTAENITDFLYEMGTKLDVGQKDQLAIEFLPVFKKGLVLVDALGEKHSGKLFQRVADLISKESTFALFKRAILEKLFLIKDQEELNSVLKYCEMFLEKLKEPRLAKAFLSDLLMTLHQKEIQTAAWPIIQELIKFVLDFLDRREPKDLRNLSIFNMTMHILQLYKVFVKKREESGELSGALRFSSPIANIKMFSDLSLFCDIVKKVQGILRKDETLIEGFAEIRGYEKICQDASYYINNEEDSIVMIRFLTDLAYCDEKCGVHIAPRPLPGRVVASIEPKSKLMHAMSMIAPEQGHSLRQPAASDRLAFRNTVKQADKFAGLTIAPVTMQTFVIPEAPPEKLLPSLKVPDMIQNIIVYLLDRSPPHFREYYINDLLTQAEHSVETYVKLRNSKVFWSLVYFGFDKDGHQEDEKTWRRIMRLFKTKPNLAAYRLMFDKYFESIQKNVQPDYEELGQLISLPVEAMSQFGEYIELTNSSTAHNNLICVSSNNLYEVSFEKVQNMQISPLTFSVWLSKDKIKFSTAKLTVFSLALVSNETVQWRLEVFWEGAEIKMRYDRNETGTKKEVLEYLYVDNPVKPLLVEHSPLHFVFTLKLMSDRKSMQGFFYINGRKVSQKEVTGIGKLSQKVPKDKDGEKKASFKAYCGVGYMWQDVAKDDSNVETTRIREVFLCKRAVEEQVIQTLHAIFFPQLRTPVNWFSEYHLLNLRHLNEDLKQLLSHIDQCVLPKSDDCNKLPEEKRRLYMKLDASKYYCDMEFIITGVPELYELCEEQSKPKLKEFLNSPYSVSNILGSKDSKSFLVSFSNSKREVSKAVIQDSFSKLPTFEYVLKAECVLERIVTVLEGASDQVFRLMIKNGILELFCQTCSQDVGRKPFYALLYLIMKKDISLQDEHIAQLVWMFGVPIERSIAPEANGSEKNYALVDPWGLCLLVDVFCDSDHPKKLITLFSLIRHSYLRESAASK